MVILKVWHLMKMLMIIMRLRFFDMPKRRRHAPSGRSMPTQPNAEGGSANNVAPCSEPIVGSAPPVLEPVPPIVEPGPSIQQDSLHQLDPSIEEDSEVVPDPPYRGRKSNKYWTVRLIDENGKTKETHLTAHDVFVLPSCQKIVLEWNKEGQPVGEAGGLLGQFLGHVACNSDNFPISYEKWPKVPSVDKEHVWNHVIKDMCERNIENRRKQKVPHTLGSKTIARKKHEMEVELGRSCGRAEIWNIAQKKNGSFVNDEAKKKSEELDMHTQNSSETEAFTKVFGKEHPGRVRSVGHCVAPSQFFGSTSYSGEETSSQANVEIQELKSEVKALRAQMAYFMEHFGAQMLDGNLNNNQAVDASSPALVRRYSSGSHDPRSLGSHNHGPSSHI
ncbi:hypothetical protein CDL12_30412 [Handroanthus impetiginosus]|uniref:Transposase Tnp1/En/Spm-like domain-containing protein n=1 Tax=Handroanthus impetiginosus TaxID=429701 RepID=A0A2G9FVN0_9LAMI|nr:hypothetical protein CDL12_30412 [Handroanthus impetiginosus]